MGVKVSHNNLVICATAESPEDVFECICSVDRIVNVVYIHDGVSQMEAYTKSVSMGVISIGWDLGGVNAVAHKGGGSS